MADCQDSRQDGRNSAKQNEKSWDLGQGAGRGFRKSQSIGGRVRIQIADCYTRDSSLLFLKSSVFLEKSWGDWNSCGEAAVLKLGWHKDIARQHPGKTVGRPPADVGLLET